MAIVQGLSPLEGKLFAALTTPRTIEELVTLSGASRSGVTKALLYLQKTQGVIELTGRQKYKQYIRVEFAAVSEDVLNNPYSIFYPPAAKPLPLHDTFGEHYYAFTDNKRYDPYVAAAAAFSFVVGQLHHLAAVGNATTLNPESTAELARALQSNRKLLDVARFNLSALSSLIQQLLNDPRYWAVGTLLEWARSENFPSEAGVAKIRKAIGELPPVQKLAEET